MAPASMIAEGTDQLHHLDGAGRPVSFAQAFTNQHMGIKLMNENDEFKKFKLAYPKREGSNPWKPAEMKFNALVKSGVSPQKIVAAVLKFAAEEKRNIGTRFIPMASTWLNQMRHQDYSDVSVSVAPPLDWDAICVSFKKFGVWSRYAGPDPESPACRAPPEILRKHGIEPLGIT